MTARADRSDGPVDAETRARDGREARGLPAGSASTPGEYADGAAGREAGEAGDGWQGSAL